MRGRGWSLFDYASEVVDAPKKWGRRYIWGMALPAIAVSLLTIVTPWAGTIFTMEQDYMKKDFRNAGIEVSVPEKEERELIAKRILEELEFGVVKETTLNEFQGIIRKMQREKGIEAVVLGCTELPLLLNEENCPVPCLDSVEIHISELIRLAMEG